MKIMKMRGKKIGRDCVLPYFNNSARIVCYLFNDSSLAVDCGSRSSNPIIPPFVIYFFNLFIFIPVAFILGSNAHTKKSLNYFSSEKCMRILKKGVDRCGLAFFSCSFTTLNAQNMTKSTNSQHNTMVKCFIFFRKSPSCRSISTSLSLSNSIGSLWWFSRFILVSKRV